IGGGFTDVNGVAQQRYAVFTGPPAPSTPPVVDSVAIDQAAPGTGDTLSATVASHDADGDPVTYAYQWTLNGGDILNATGPTLDLSSGGNGDKGDVIRVRVTASDGASSSPAVTPADVTAGELEAPSEAVTRTRITSPLSPFPPDDRSSVGPVALRMSPPLRVHW